MSDLAIVKWVFSTNPDYVQSLFSFSDRGRSKYHDMIKGLFVKIGVKGLGKPRYIHLVYPPDTHLGTQKLFVAVEFL